MLELYPVDLGALSLVDQLEPVYYEYFCMFSLIGKHFHVEHMP